MTDERCVELRLLVQGLRNSAEMSHTADQDTAAAAITELLDEADVMQADLKHACVENCAGGCAYASQPCKGGTNFVIDQRAFRDDDARLTAEALATVGVWANHWRPFLSTGPEALLRDLDATLERKP